MTLLDEPTVRRRAQELLERLGLADRSREPIAGFSKGMVQRLGLAQALLNDPDLLVLDEPAEGLDLLGRRLVHDVIGERKKQGRTAILVSHALSDVAALCDRVAVLVGGRLNYLGALAALTAGARPLEQAVQDLYAGAVA
jgi:ABC-2 type transport system ATP-binding protein